MDQNTEEQAGLASIQIVEDLWNANKPAREELIQAVLKYHAKQIPSILGQLPGMAEFLLDFQHRSFALGVFALMRSVVTAQQQPASRRPD